jgi:hypothetical protein
MRTYGRQALRGIGATLFLGLFGTVAALLPIALLSLLPGHDPGHPALYMGAAIVGGAAIGWLMKPGSK